MLNIAICTDSFLPTTDGVGRVSFAYAQGLARRGHAVYVVTPMVNTGYRGDYPFEIVDFVSGLKIGSQNYLPSTAMLDMHYLYRADALKLDVVHAHSPGPAGMEAARLASRLRVPLVGTFHPKYFEQYFSDSSPDAPTTSAARSVLDYYNRCDEVWTSSPEARERLIRLGITCGIAVIESGTFIKEADPYTVGRLKRELHLTDAPILLCVGSLERGKHLTDILHAAALLKQRGVSFQLLFVGEGPEETAVKSRSHELGLMGITRFLGAVSDYDRLDAIYAATALCLFPWQSVSTGLPVCEAAAQGTPSLVTEGTASAAAVDHGVSGLVCPNTPKAMADAIEQVLARPDWLAGLGQQAKQTVPVSWDTVLDQVTGRYQTLERMDRAALRRKRGPFRKELQQMDQTLEKRTLDLALRFLKQDMQNIYVYPYQPTKAEFTPTPDPQPLPRATPESQGISTRAINGLLDAIHSDPAADAHAIMVLRHGKVIAEASWEPYIDGLPRQLYSLSKSVTSTAIGMLVDEGLLDLDERLVDIFADKAPVDPSHPAQALTVRHALLMSTGSLFNELGTALGSDWESEFLHAGVKFPAGTAFEYNSLNTYILAAIVRRRSGQTLTQYLAPRLFEPLGIESYHWETCPFGTEKGGWGLSLSVESVAKLGQLYLNQGRWTVDGQTRQLISQDWIQEATRAQIDTPDGEITYGYGYQIWMTGRPGAFLFNGAFGQYMLALPDCDAIVVLFSGTARLFAQGGVMEAVNLAFENRSDAPLPEDPAAVEACAVTKAALTARMRAPFFDPARQPVPFDTVCNRLNGLVYSFDANVASLLPVNLACVSNNFGPGISQVAFRMQPNNQLRIEFSEGDALHRVFLSETGYQQSAIRQRQDAYLVRTNYQTELLGPDEWALHINVHFIETPCTRVLHFLFRADGVALLCDEYPSVKDASEMLLTLSGVTKQQAVRALMPLLKREHLQNQLKTFTTVSLQGHL